MGWGTVDRGFTASQEGMRWTLLCCYNFIYTCVLKGLKPPTDIKHWMAHGFLYGRVGVAWSHDATDKAMGFKVHWSVSWNSTSLARMSVILEYPEHPFESIFLFLKQYC